MTDESKLSKTQTLFLHRALELLIDMLSSAVPGTVRTCLVFYLQAIHFHIRGQNATRYWGIRTNLEHRGIRDCQPLKIGDDARISDSLIYNGCIIEGEVERSILFPGTHVEKGAKVKDSVLFFNNVVGKEAMLDKVISDVNTTFGRGVRINTEGKPGPKEVSVIGWNNFIKANTIIGSGCTVYPSLPSEKIPKQVESGEVIR